MKSLKRVLLVMAAVLAVVPCGFAGSKPLKIYILAGQSNMQGQAQKSVLPGMAADPASKALYDKLVDQDGNVRVFDNIHIVALSRQGKASEDSVKHGPLTVGFGGDLSGDTVFGPELAFGVTLQESLQEPILLIKASWGGKSLLHDFRPPSAGEWEAPEGHPDHPDSQSVSALPIPKTFTLPADFVAPTRGRHMQIMKGATIGEFDGTHPLYIAMTWKSNVDPELFKVGDVILGIDGHGLGDDPVGEWRKAWFSSTMSEKDDWMITITRWRDGKIETFDFDIAETLEGGRASIDEVVANRKAAAQKGQGTYYRQMMQHVKTVLADLATYHPAYDPKQGYEIAGFVWFQGYNDYIASGTYPSRGMPGGYDQYSWLLSHFIRDVRKDLNVPKLPFVIGALGVGGYEQPPTSMLGYFQTAMAAPAEDPAFKGTVAAVQTGKFWDTKLAELAGKKDRSPEEERYVKENLSNSGFHYYGSAKVYSLIGEAFAKAMVELKEKGKS